VLKPFRSCQERISFFLIVDEGEWIGGEVLIEMRSGCQYLVITGVKRLENKVNDTDIDGNV
jgi:hypothetical protein